LLKVAVSVRGPERRKHVTIGKPLVFFNLVCKVSPDKQREINHWHDSLLQDSPQCKQTDELLQIFENLRGATNTVALTTPFQPTHTSMDVSGEQSLGAVAFMDFTSKNPEAELPPIMQVMHGNLEEPTGDVTYGGSDRIWFVTKLRDVSASADVGVPERVALDLTGLDRDGFKNAAATGDIQFPLLCNFRVSRSLKDTSEAGAAQPSASEKFVNHTIQQTTPIEWNAAIPPNAAYEPILGLLNNYPRHEESILFGYLSDIRTDPHYGFQLAFPNGNVRKGAAAVVVIAAMQKSQ